MSPYRFLHVEDSPEDAALVEHSLAQASFTFTITRVDTEAAYIEQIRTSVPDVILCDYDLPQFSAERALTILHEHAIEVPFIVISNHIDANAAVVAMQNGASDYLPKSGLRRLAKAIESAIDRGSMRREKAVAQHALLESEALRRAILDSLLSRIALIDGAGTIVAVNKEWKRFEDEAIAVTGHGLEPGANYVKALEAAIDRGDAHAADLAAGLRGVIDRETPVFSMQYAIASGRGPRWFIARAVPLEGSSAATVVSHRDVSERMLGHVALDEATSRLRTLSKRMLSIQEEERRSISRELHDDIGQILSALKIGLHRLSSAPDATKPPLVLECVEAAGLALEKVRGLALELRPPQLDQLGLQEALEWLAQRQAAATGIEITCKCAGLAARPSNSLESTCYRIVQEALNNATRHASAAHIAIAIESDGVLLKVVVRDDGVGFDQEAARLRVLRAGNMGLIGMEERAQLSGGRLKVRSVQGGGTTVSAIFPLADKASGRTPRLEAEIAP